MLALSQVLLRLRVDHLENRSEDWLAARATNEEPIDIGQLDQILAVGLSYRTTVQDASFIRDGLASIVFEPAPDRLDRLLRLISTRNFASVKRPDRLVANDDSRPVGPFHNFLDRLKLRKNNFITFLCLVLG